MRSCLLLILGLSFLSSQAQIEFRSFQEVLDYADEHAIAIQQAQIGEQISQAGKKEANAWIFPSISATAGYNDNLTLQPTLVPAKLFNPTAAEETFEELVFGRKYLYSTGVQAQWDVLNFQRIFASQTASLQAEASRLQTEKSRFQTYNQLASSYYSILLTQESIEIYEENVQTSATILESARGKYLKGFISEAELNRAQIRHLQNQSNLSLATNNLEQFSLQLQSQLNTREEIILEDSPDQFSLEDAAIQTTHPEVLWQEAEIAKSHAMVKQMKSLQLPALSLVYQYNHNWATDQFMDFSTANKLPQQIFGVSIQVPVFRGFSTRQKINQSVLELEFQQLQLENTRLVKAQEDELLLLQRKQAADQLTNLEKMWQLQQKNDGHAENKYQSGIISLDERLNAYDELLTLQNNYLQSLANYTLAQYKLFLRQLNYRPED